MLIMSFQVYYLHLGTRNCFYAVPNGDFDNNQSSRTNSCSWDIFLSSHFCYKRHSCESTHHTFLYDVASQSFDSLSSSRIHFYIFYNIWCNDHYSQHNSIPALSHNFVNFQQVDCSQGNKIEKELKQNNKVTYEPY